MSCFAGEAVGIFPAFDIGLKGFFAMSRAFFEQVFLPVHFGKVFPGVDFVGSGLGGVEVFAGFCPVLPGNVYAGEGKGGFEGVPDVALAVHQVVCDFVFCYCLVVVAFFFPDSPEM